MNLKINPKNIGKCYELSLQFVLSHPDWNLIHGYITNKQPPFQMIDHSWCVKDDIVRDVVFEKDFPIVVHDALFSPKIIKEYTFDEVIDMMNKFGTYGPWHEVELFDRDYYDEFGKLRDKYK